MKITRRGVITFVLVTMFAALVLFVGYVTFIGIQFARGFKEYAKASDSEASVADYKTIRERWFTNGLVSHFPDAIPDEAKNVKLYYQSAFLQRGAVFQVRFSLPPDEITKTYESAVLQKTKSFRGGDFGTHVLSPDGLPTTLFYTSGAKPTNGWSTFPTDYEVMAFDSLSTNNLSSSHWKSHGVAISKTRNEVVYWAEIW